MSKQVDQPTSGDRFWAIIKKQQNFQFQLFGVVLYFYHISVTKQQIHSCPYKKLKASASTKNCFCPFLFVHASSSDNSTVCSKMEIFISLSCPPLWLLPEFNQAEVWMAIPCHCFTCMLFCLHKYPLYSGGGRGKQLFGGQWGFLHLQGFSVQIIYKMS